MTYGCHPGTARPPVLSPEHREAALFTEPQLAELRLPAGYRRSITAWFSHPERH